MRYRSPLPRGPLLEGVIVYDYDMLCIVPRTMQADEAEDTEASDERSKLMRRWGSIRSLRRRPSRKRMRIYGERLSKE